MIRRTSSTQAVVGGRGAGAVALQPPIPPAALSRSLASRSYFVLKFCPEIPEHLLPADRRRYDRLGGHRQNRTPTCKILSIAAGFRNALFSPARNRGGFWPPLPAGFLMRPPSSRPPLNFHPCSLHLMDVPAP